LRPGRAKKGNERNRAREESEERKTIEGKMEK
jgi:hypothetical protein